jgi:hypothetical protein
MALNASPLSMDTINYDLQVPQQPPFTAAGNKSPMLCNLNELQDDAMDGDAINDACEDDLSEEQLRKLYDDEEINQFLHLFSAVSPLYYCGAFLIIVQYVTEVRLPSSPSQVQPSDVKYTNVPTDGVASEDIYEGEVSTRDSCNPPLSKHPPLTQTCISEEIAKVSMGIADD